MPRIARTISPHAPALRRNMTDAEHFLWTQLRARRLAGHKFKRQWAIGSHVVDFCCWEQRLIVEVDGGQHRPEADARRTAYLEREGYRIIRFWNHEVLGNMDGVLTSILQNVSSDPHPGPLPQAGEGD